MVLIPLCYDEGYYQDQQNLIKVKVDPISLKILSKEPCPVQKNEFFEQYTKNIEDGLKLYMKSYYKNMDAGFTIYNDWDEDDFTIYIGITCKDLNFKNFKGGEWISEWKVNGTKMEGKIRINAHFFEDGNVALKDVKNCEKSGIFKGENAILESQIMVDFIKEQESLIHASLQKMYGEMSQLFFKGMRRLLPISGQKMDWAYNVHRVR